MSLDFTAGIVRILNRQGQTVGTGFVVSDLGLVTTCAHVVQSGGAGPGDPIRLTFHRNDLEITATVEPDSWCYPEAEDVAFLRLDVPLPEGIAVLPIGPANHTSTYLFETFGFANANQDEGLRGKGEFLGMTTIGGVQVMQLRSPEITAGFSGAPVWDQDLQYVVGMVTAIARVDEFGRLPETAFATPVETLVEIRPELTLASAPPDLSLKTLEADIAQAIANYQSHIYHVVIRLARPTRPYKFLDSFELEDAAIFFGRTTAITELHAKLGQSRLTVLHARSGAGKTSLLKAGLSPRLVGDALLPIYVRASQDPVLAIKRAIIPPSRSIWPELMAKISLQEFLGLVCLHLGDQVKELIIMLDQFEEFLAFYPQTASRQPFIDALADCYDDRSLPVRFIIALRGDYLSELATFSGRLPRILDNSYFLDNMTRAEAALAITEPLSFLKPDISFETALLDALLDDLEGSGMELPHLQIICTHLYKLDQTVITLERYESLGRAEGVLTDYLSHQLEDRFNSEQEIMIAEEVLKAVVSSEATKRMLDIDTLEATVRRKTDLADLKRATLSEILAQLVDARLLRRHKETGVIKYEMAHEYLAAEIRSWLNQDEEDVKKAEELLERELANWRAIKTLMSVDHLRVIAAQYLYLKPDMEARAFLLRSALASAYNVLFWWQDYSDSAQAADITLSFLMGDDRHHAQKLADTLWPEGIPINPVLNSVAQEITAFLRSTNAQERQRASEAQVFIGPIARQLPFGQFQLLKTAFRLLVPKRWSAILIVALGGLSAGLIGGVLQVVSGIGFAGDQQIKLVTTYGLAMATLGALIGIGWQLGIVLARGRSLLSEVFWAACGGALGGFIFVFYFTVLGIIEPPFSLPLLILNRTLVFMLMAIVIVIGMRLETIWPKKSVSGGEEISPSSLALPPDELGYSIAVNRAWSRVAKQILTVVGLSTVGGLSYDLLFYGHPNEMIVGIWLGTCFAAGLSLAQLRLTRR